MASPALEDQAHGTLYFSSFPRYTHGHLQQGGAPVGLQTHQREFDITRQGSRARFQSSDGCPTLEWPVLAIPFKALHNGSSLETINLEYSILCNALAEVGRKIVDKQSAELDQTIVELQSLIKHPPALTSRTYLYMPQCPMCGRAESFVRALRARP